MKQINDKQLSEDFIEFLITFNRKFFRQTALPLPVNHFITLIVLNDDPGLTISSLSDKLHISKQQMTPIIDKLLRSGYVSRQIQANDRRCSNISLTAKGQNIIQSHNAENSQHLAQLIAGLSAAEINDFDASLRVLSKTIDKMFSAH